MSTPLLPAERASALRPRLAGKTLALCLPGRRYSGRFLTKFAELVSLATNQLGLRLMFSQAYTPVVADCRMRVAGGSNDGGRLQAPFGGQPYDYMLWIDSDIAFEFEHLLNLLELDGDIVSGWYAQPGGATATVERADDADFLRDGRYRFLTIAEIEARAAPFAVDHTGLGWMLVRRGVFEKLPMPWFEHTSRWLADAGREVIVPCSEDAAFCLKARAAGFRILLDPRTRVGHEKEFVI